MLKIVNNKTNKINKLIKFNLEEIKNTISKISLVINPSI